MAPQVPTLKQQGKNERWFPILPFPLHPPNIKTASGLAPLCSSSFSKTLCPGSLTCLCFIANSCDPKLQDEAVFAETTQEITGQGKRKAFGLFQATTVSTEVPKAATWKHPQTVPQTLASQQGKSKMLSVSPEPTVTPFALDPSATA